MSEFRRFENEHGAQFLSAEEGSMGGESAT
jgi:hypothetical protein